MICDFEEAVDRDYDGWPDGWIRRRSRLFPEFLKIGIVEEPGCFPATAGGSDTIRPQANHCLEIQLDGGGAVLSSPPQPISPQFSLSLTMRMKTEGLKHDGAWVELGLLDAEGNVIETRESAPLTRCPEWQTVSLGPFAMNARIAKAVVTLHVQPLGKREDLTGRAWFDDLRITRLPRMQLSASNPTGLYTKRDAAELTCSVSGIRVRNPRVRFELFS